MDYTSWTSRALQEEIKGRRLSRGDGTKAGMAAVLAADDETRSVRVTNAMWDSVDRDEVRFRQARRRAVRKAARLTRGRRV